MRIVKKKIKEKFIEIYREFIEKIYRRTKHFVINILYFEASLKNVCHLKKSYSSNHSICN